MVAMAKEHGLKIYFLDDTEVAGVLQPPDRERRATDALPRPSLVTCPTTRIINALLLWAADREPEDLVKELGPYLGAPSRGIWDEVLALPRRSSESPDASVSAAGRVGATGGDTRKSTMGDWRYSLEGPMAITPSSPSEESSAAARPRNASPRKSRVFRSRSATPTIEPGKGEGDARGKASS